MNKGKDGDERMGDKTSAHSWTTQFYFFRFANLTTKCRSRLIIQKKKNPKKEKNWLPKRTKFVSQVPLCSYRHGGEKLSTSLTSVVTSGNLGHLRWKNMADDNLDLELK